MTTSSPTPSTRSVEPQGTGRNRAAMSMMLGRDYYLQVDSNDYPVHPS